MTQERVNILGVTFDNVNMQEAVNRGKAMLETEAKDTVYTPNPEIVIEAYRDDKLQTHLNEGSLVIPDGIGVVIGSRIIRKPLKERVAGYDFIQNMFDYLKDTDKTVYFYGAKPGVAEKAAKEMMAKYHGLKVVGTCDGYEKDNNKILQDIIEKSPDMLLVGLGAPKQECWICDNKSVLPCRMYVGVGGSFDGMAGLVKRAPEIFIKLNLEWFYRLMKQPSRWKRMLRLPLFLIKMVFEGRKYN